MLTGLGGPFKGNPVFPRTQSSGGKCPETSEGCLLELGGLGPQRPYAHMESCLGTPGAWKFWKGGQIFVSQTAKARLREQEFESQLHRFLTEWDI